MAGIIVPKTGRPLGYEQLTVSTTSVGLTVPTSANAAVIDVETAEVRWRDDGTAPTATVGVRASDTDKLQLFGTQVSAIRFIRTGSSDAKLNISYYQI